MKGKKMNSNSFFCPSTFCHCNGTSHSASTFNARFNLSYLPRIRLLRFGKMPQSGSNGKKQGNRRARQAASVLTERLRNGK